MKKAFISVCFLLSQWCAFSQTETENIQDVFNRYKSAIIAEDGVKAIEYMDSHTLEYYSTLLSHVLHADSLKLESLSLMEKFSVLSVRHMATKKEILAFTDKSFIDFTIKNGMMGKNKLEGITLGKITVKDKSAKAQIFEEGKKSDKFYHFYSDGVHWKIDITPLFPIEEKETEDFIKETGKPENEFLLGMLELMTQKTPSPSIWKKIK